LAVASPPFTLFPSPPPEFVLLQVRNFVGALAVAGKTFKEIEETAKIF
jgi:hypothetical protein